MQTFVKYTEHRDFQQTILPERSIKILDLEILEKKKEIWLNPMTKPLHPWTKQRDNTETPPKLILNNDCGPT